MHHWFDKDSILISVLDYPLSYLELMGWISGIVAVALSSMTNVWSWPIGIVNVVLSFFLFYQVQLYPDMFLQVFFFVTNILGWWRWTHPKKDEEDTDKKLRVTLLNRKSLLILMITTVFLSAIFGVLASDLHNLLPRLFNKPSAAPFLDSLVMVLSIAATYLMVQKKVECWAVWIAVDAIATYLYFIRGIKFYSLLYFAFCFIAAYGLWHWYCEYRKHETLANVD